MRLLPWRRHSKLRPVSAEHGKVMSDLKDKDRVIDDLLQTADDLVSELRVSLSQAADSLRRSAAGGDDDDRG